MEDQKLTDPCEVWPGETGAASFAERDKGGGLSAKWDLCISGTKGAAYSQSLTKGDGLSDKWDQQMDDLCISGTQGGGLFPKSYQRDGLSVKWDQQIDGLCISGTKGTAYSKSLTKGTVSLPSGTSRWTASVLVGQRGRPILKVLPKGRPLRQVGPTDGRPLY